MPIVNGKHYPYTKKGKAAAKKAMKKNGMTMEMHSEVTHKSRIQHMKKGGKK